MTIIFDKPAMFSRIRNHSRSGMGIISYGTLAYQMGGGKGDPYGWSRARIDAAFRSLVEEGSIERRGPIGEYWITDGGMKRYVLGGSP